MLTYYAGIINKGTILFLLFSSKCILACLYGGTVPDDETLETLKKEMKGNNPHMFPSRPKVTDYSHEDDPLNLTNIKNDMDRNVKVAWGRGWTPSPAVQDDWKAWLEQYKKKKEKQNDYVNKHNKKKLEKERQADGTWPSSWGDLGEGHEGAPPPPWAYVPKHDGKPSLCFVAPRYGNCANPVVRYGYNPYTEKCEPYSYSGCFGSKNNFETLLKCQEKCEVPPPQGCIGDSGITKDYTPVLYGDVDLN